MLDKCRRVCNNESVEPKEERENLMKVRFIDASREKESLALLSSDLGIAVAEENEVLTVRVEHSDADALTVALDGEHATITYGGGLSRFHRALGLLFEAIKEGKTSFHKKETPSFEKNGYYLDVSRNAVMRPSVIKEIMRKIALMGMNTFWLYMEDMYEIENEPYFGHMRGRYTKAELKELDAYALSLGIELVPAIQCLGHMERFLSGESGAKYRDQGAVLLVGEESTYDLISRMLATVTECFTTKRLIIGFDEAGGLGRGAYFKKHGYREQIDIYCEHLNRVVDMTRERGLDPIIFSDMFFSTADPVGGYYNPNVVFSEHIKGRVPKDVTLCYWDYNNGSYEMYDGMIKKHREIGDNKIIFAGGIWTWVGAATYYSLSIKNTEQALTACRNHGIKEVFATTWHDVCLSFRVTALAGCQMFAEMDYTGAYDEEAVRRRFAFICGEDARDLWDMEEIDQPHKADAREIAGPALLYNDPLIGLLDWHMQDVDGRAHYGAIARKYKDKKGNSPLFAPSFNVFRHAAAFLALKADFGVRLKAAYDAGDREALKALLDDCRLMGARCEALRRAHREAWLYYNKPFGLETVDARYGAITARIDTAAYRIECYLKGEADALEELAEDRLKFNYSDFGERRERTMYYANTFAQYLTPGRF